MKKYLDLEGFQTFLSSLKEDTPASINYESTEDSTSDPLPFMKVKFAGVSMILCMMPSSMVTVIQDTPVAPIEDYISDLFSYLSDKEHKLYIEE